MKVFLIISVTIFVYISEVAVEETVTTETKVGTIIGTTEDVNVFGEIKKVIRYLGIPYAEPPTGERRFQKPVPKRPFMTPWKALRHGNACSQMLVIPNKKGLSYDEDCLILNVYKPAEIRNRYLAVMVYIHGGGFAGGSADAHISDSLSLYGDVIVVTINYRLSVFGFLSTEDEHCPGNYGLWDQHLALKWVHSNIESFEGDPKRVTIFGESAGSSSVVYQCLYEGNSGLFQRAIAQSGSITANWSFLKAFKPVTESFGKIIGCTNMESGQLVDCIRNQTTKKVTSILNDPNKGLMAMPFPFLPSIDGEFIKEPPRDVLNSITGLSSNARKFFSSLDFMTGINAEEGILMLPAFLKIDPDNFFPNKSYFEEVLVPQSLRQALGIDVPELIKYIVASEYTNWDDPYNKLKIREKLTELTSDFMFGVPMLEAIDLQSTLSGSKRTYMYLFDVLPSTRLFYGTPSWSKRGTHAEELIYLFFEQQGGMASLLLGTEYTPKQWERRVAQRMMTLWTNFAKTG